MRIQWQNSSFDPVVFAGRNYIIKRDDLLLPIGGNKARKLYHLSKQDLSSIKSIVSFGGAQSNAMLALSQFCSAQDIQFNYYTRPVPGWLKKKPLGNLAAALDNDMQWHISDSGLPPDKTENGSLLIPQGISMPEAQLGIQKLAKEIEQYCDETNMTDIAVVLPSGTGATALYLQQHLTHTVYTIPCIGNADTLTALFQQQLPNTTRYPVIIGEKVSEKFRFDEPHIELLTLYQQLQEATGIEFELLYDAKAWLTLEHWECDKPIIYIHNGGTSGNASMLARYRRLGMLGNE